MTRPKSPPATPLALAASAAALAACVAVAPALTGCGRVGPLDQPPPLFGAKAKAAYYAQRSEQAQAGAQNAADQRNETGSAERSVDNEPAPATNTTDSSDPNADDAPLTTRDVQDPNQKLTLPRDAPVPGAPNSAGPLPSTTPP